MLTEREFPWSKKERKSGNALAIGGKRFSTLPPPFLPSSPLQSSSSSLPPFWVDLTPFSFSLKFLSCFCSDAYGGRRGKEEGLLASSYIEGGRTGRRSDRGRDKMLSLARGCYWEFSQGRGRRGGPAGKLGVQRDFWVIAVVTRSSQTRGKKSLSSASPPPFHYILHYVRS